MEQEIKNKVDTHDLHKICCNEPEKATSIEAGLEDGAVRAPRYDHHFLGICIVLAALIVGGTWIYTARLKYADPAAAKAATIAELEEAVLPDSVTLPVQWGDLGKQLVDNGSIDSKKFEELYTQRGDLDEETKKLLYGTDNGPLVMTKDNANTILNLLWALGLASKNEILEKGPMMDKQYGGDAGGFASTGGWTLAVGSPMNHYSHHAMIPLTPEQQALVVSVSKGIYRPCCGNSVHFPDCNHGMAMLGLLELMASQGVGEDEMYKAALAVNAYWFPDTYMTIAQYLKTKGLDWEDASPREILGQEFSSAGGYQKIRSLVEPIQGKSGGSCGV